jgi:phospholipid/cholesterol/gamma-HCH transport system substrate-binding protein
MIDPRTKNNIAASMENLNRITTSLAYSSASLQTLLNTQTGSLAKTLDNMNSVTSNLASNNPKINSVVDNLDKTTSKLSQLDLKKTIDSLDVAVNNLKNVIAQVNSNNGTLGKIMNDPTLYNNLASTSNKMNLLLDDIRINPKRYVSISVFGKKGSNPPLMVPLPDTVSSPYIIKTVNDR